MGWPSRIVIVRHAESEGNIKSPNDISLREKANHNFRLTEKGKQQAKTTGEFIRSRYGKFDAYICSTFDRTQETLSIMFHDVTSIIDSRLDEMLRGIWHTMTEEEISKYYPEERRIWDREGWYHYRAPGGQNGQDVELIICSFLSYLRELYGDKNILIVGHGTWMIFLWRIMFNHSIKEAEAKYMNEKYKNASVTVLEKKGAGMVLTMDNYVPPAHCPTISMKWYEFESWVTPEEVKKATNDLRTFMSTDSWQQLLNYLRQTGQKEQVYVWKDACDDYEAMYLTGDGFVNHHGRRYENLTEVVENFMTHDFYGARESGGNWDTKRHPSKLIPWLELMCKICNIPRVLISQ